MATIQIGGRTLEVKEATIGFWRRLKDQPTTGLPAIEATVALFLELLGQNDGVTREWLEDNLPMTTSLNAKFNELLAASGLSIEPRPGEAEAR